MPENPRGFSDDRGKPIRSVGAEKKPKLVEVKEEDRHHAQQAVEMGGEEPPRESMKRSGLVRTSAVRRSRNGAMMTYACRTGGK